MDNTTKLQEEIRRFKKEQGAIILAHNYQIPEIHEIADYLGDSLALAKISKNLDEKLIILCGVKFMAETAKILSPEKEIILPILDAGCPLADMIDPEQLKKIKKENPDAYVVSYVNTSAEIKALSDVCCTSANAVNVVKNIPVKKVIFVPDKNLAWWVKKSVPEKEIIAGGGYCIVHEYFSIDDLRKIRQVRPNAEILAHPECRSEILEESDHVLSTAGMLKHAKESSAFEFIIGTEEGLIYRLQKENPKKSFYSLGNAKICVNMKKVTLESVLYSLKNKVHKVNLDEETIRKAKNALEEMVKYV